jgi:dTDP-L-rhamnose 4-epimerase
LVYEDGDQMRDFIYVGDVARANLFVMENEKADFQVFNVGTGKATSIAGLARRLSSLYGKSIEPKIPGEFRLGDVRHILLNPAKLEQLGFRPTTSLEKGFSLSAEWMRSQGPVEEYFTKAHAHLKRNRIIHG